MKDTSPIIHQTKAWMSQISLLLKFSVPLTIATLNVACTAADTLVTPSLSAAQPEMTTQSETTPSPATADENSPSTPTAMPEPVESSDVVPVGAQLPTLPSVEPTAEPESEVVNTEIPAQLNPTPVTCMSSESDVQQRILQLINEARATARVCGSENFPAARALQWNTDLADAARGHSEDMALHNFFDHTGSDGSSASVRVTAAGYQWRTVGENIAAGRETLAETLVDWLESPGHCRNLMNPSFAEVAVSCVEDDSSDFRRYWTNVLAAPR